MTDLTRSAKRGGLYVLARLCDPTLPETIHFRSLLQSHPPSRVYNHHACSARSWREKRCFRFQFLPFFPLHWPERTRPPPAPTASSWRHLGATLITPTVAAIWAKRLGAAAVSMERQRLTRIGGGSAWWRGGPPLRVAARRNSLCQQHTAAAGRKCANTRCMNAYCSQRLLQRLQLNVISSHAA